MPLIDLAWGKTEAAQAMHDACVASGFFYGAFPLPPLPSHTHAHSRNESASAISYLRRVFASSVSLTGFLVILHVVSNQVPDAFMEELPTHMPGGVVICSPLPEEGLGFSAS